MISVWIEIPFFLASLAVILALALCKIAALAAEEARRALEDERWATIPPTRTPADLDDLVLFHEAPARSKR
jgi:hypothetical protein